MDDTNQKIPSGLSGQGALTICLLCLGLAMVAMCVIIPQADANRRLAYERDKLLADLRQIDQQASVNEEFLKNIEINPQLAQRLAQRQMKFIRQGESLLPIKTNAASDTALVAAEHSPYALMRVSPPPAQPPYQPAGGIVAVWLLDSHIRLYCLAGGMFLVAMGLVLSANDQPAVEQPAKDPLNPRFGN
jgi:hypothetical protein